MNTGQSLFTIGALLLLSLTVLRVNNSILVTDNILQDSKLGVLATSVVTSLMEEASKKAFDEGSVDDAVLDVSALTAAGDLHYDSGEDANDSGTFDDFDDYNGYIQQDTINTIDYSIACTVSYVDPDNIDGTTTIKTWHKKITVTVTSSFYKDPLTFSTIYSYWHFR